MHKKNKTIILDIDALDKIGLDQFLKSHEWPVNEKDFRNLANVIFYNYISYVKKLNGIDYNIAIIELRFLTILTQILHYNYVKNYARINSIKLLETHRANFFLYPNWKEIEKSFSVFSYPYNKIWRNIRSIIKDIIFNTHLPFSQVLIGLFSKKKCISIGSFDKLKKQYIRETNLFFHHVEWIDEINKIKNNDQFNGYKAIKKFRNNVVIPLFRKLKNNNTLKYFIEGLDLNSIENSWMQRISDLYKISAGLAKQKSLTTLAVTECGNPFHKILCSAYKRKNSKVVIFNHGNDTCLIDQTWTKTYLFSLCDYVVFENKKIKTNFLNYKKSLPLNLLEKIKYINVTKEEKKKNKYFLNLSNNQNRIILIGFPMNTTRYIGDTLCFFNFKIKTEIHLLKELSKKNTYKIAYKAHPSTSKEMKKILSSKVKLFLSRKLEDILSRQDILIFTYTSTSTFGYALKSKCPIILINYEKTAWIKKRKKNLEKRVAFISYKKEKDYKKIKYEDIAKAIKLARKKVKNNIITNI
tara:strand:- start:142 stop:1716 length:1575 start_codon:yes stop_codon:yes gene_type:complete